MVSHSFSHSNNLIHQVTSVASHPKLMSAIFHIALVLVVTLKIVLFNIEDGQYTRSIHKTLLFAFDPYGWASQDNVVQLFTINDTVHSLERTLETYGMLSNISLTDFSYRHSSGGPCQEGPTIVNAETIYWESSSSLRSYSKAVTNTTDLSFITDNPEAYFATLDTLRLNMHLCNTHVVQNPYTISGKPVHERCYVWEIFILYRFISQVYITVEIDDRLHGACEGTENKYQYQESHSIWLEVSSILLSVVYLAVVLRGIRSAYKYYMRVRAAHAKARAQFDASTAVVLEGEDEGGGGGGGGHIDSLQQQEQEQQHPQQDNPLLDSRRRERVEAALGHSIMARHEWSEVTWAVKRRFLPTWLLTTLMGVVLCITDAAYRINNRTEYIPTTAPDKLMLGCSCLLLWGCTLQFLTFDRRVYAVVASISVAAPRLLPYFVGVLPIFAAFCFFAIAYWGSELGAFSTLTQAAKTCFSLMNGDSIHDILSLMKLRSITITAFFAVGFMVIAFYLIMNIVIAIVEEAYFLAKKRKRHLEILVERRLALSVESMAEEEDDVINSLLAGERDAASPPAGSLLLDSLRLTRQEQIAEVYMLGRTHYEYSKIMDFLSLCMIGEWAGAEKGGGDNRG